MSATLRPPVDKRAKELAAKRDGQEPDPQLRALQQELRAPPAEEWGTLEEDGTVVTAEARAPSRARGAPARSVLCVPLRRSQACTSNR